MSIRQLKLPEDLTPISGMMADTWNYPDNPEWSVQPDEEQSMAESVENYRRIWPLIRLVQLLSPGLRDFMHGHVWEEGGNIAGFTQFGRRGTTDTWYISAVGVHPDFRRRGIAEDLVRACIDFVRERGGKRLLLDVIEGNIPAVRLYEKLGFLNFTSNLQMELDPMVPVPEQVLPSGYSIHTAGDFDWRPRFNLMQSITPQEIRTYEPVEEARYRRPFLLRVIYPIIKRAEGLQIQRFFIYSATEEVVAYGMYDTRTRELGRNEISAQLDPQHPALAEYLVKQMLHEVLSSDPKRKVEFNIASWQEPLLQVADQVGFYLRVKLLTLGKHLSKK